MSFALGYQENMVLVKEIATLRQELKNAHSNRLMAKSKSRRISSVSTTDKIMRVSKDPIVSISSKPRQVECPFTTLFLMFSYRSASWAFCTVSCLNQHRIGSTSSVKLQFKGNFQPKGQITDTCSQASITPTVCSLRVRQGLPYP